jgi:predicted ATPase
VATDDWAYLTAIRTVLERLPPDRAFPFSLPFVPTLNFTFTTPVTFFVGENGTGKSTLLEAVAVLCRFPVSGGGRNELGHQHGPEQDSVLSRVLRPAFRRQPRNGYFFRAEFQAHFASLLDERAADPDFIGDPFALYGGRSLHSRSHGESFLDVLQNRIGTGLYLLDEPESALSPQRQLALLAIMNDLVRDGQSQFVIATHSPILLTFPGARLVSFDDPVLPAVTLEQTSHYQITRGILEAPDRYWKQLSERT